MCDDAVIVWCLPADGQEVFPLVGMLDQAGSGEGGGLGLPAATLPHVSIKPAEGDNLAAHARNTKGAYLYSHNALYIT